MKVEIHPFDATDKKKFEEVRKVREKVFVIEQEVDESEEFDEFEEVSTHYQLIVDGRTVGTARWRTIKEKVKLERFAILREFRGKKYGDKLLKKVIDDSSKENKPMYLHAQLKAIPFYGRRGFEKVGNLFSECDIEHYKMVLENNQLK